MTDNEKNIQIIGNESNQVFEVESGGTPAGREPNTTADKMREKENSGAGFPETGAPRSNPEIVGNDGSLIETMDTAFHGQPGQTEGLREEGSSRADAYEARNDGKSDAEKELEMLSDE